MRFSSVLRVIIRGPNGQPIWREVSDLRLPKGGKTVSFGQVSLLLYFIFVHFTNVCDFH
uniref:Uncharacterized protein n=1 Tax=Angiostrongylus cantonensis TaxID=6313 RepID=A0A0K0DKF8_ANGCA